MPSPQNGSPARRPVCDDPGDGPMQPLVGTRWISGGVNGVSVGGSAIVGALTVATLACLLRRWVVVFMAAVCSYRPVASSARSDTAFAPVRRPDLGQDAVPHLDEQPLP